MSRMTPSGTRRSTRSTWPSGFTNPRMSTSAGMSCAAGRAAQREEKRRCERAQTAQVGEASVQSVPQCILAAFRTAGQEAGAICGETLAWVMLGAAVAGLNRAGADADLPGRSTLAEAARQFLDSRIGHRRRGRPAGSHLDRASRCRFADGAHRGRAQPRRRPARRRAARRRRSCSSSIRRARSSPTGADRDRALTGRCRRAALTSMTRATCGLRRRRAGARDGASRRRRAACRRRTRGRRRTCGVRSWRRAAAARGGAAAVAAAAAVADRVAARRRAAPPRPADAHVLKFTRTASSCCRSARPEKSATRTARPTSTVRPTSRSTPRPMRSTSPTAAPASASSVFDATTGAYKRQWGGHGTRLRAADAA